ncbi:arogenate dehydrogenase 1, chloroplastic-like isoform X2 [Actinidia eriantha]|uniref:arogenate dehydrogenase 1, chloroplastic-like isoform X2 n=1 Tax=Actinidia eriantha TaxID=165200 RepID=UPI00258CBF36|nr:arogenate dehydrogenase 1, chloroplastic-like isoform X2 [Actinidia eriantha]
MQNISSKMIHSSTATEIGETSHYSSVPGFWYSVSNKLLFSLSLSLTMSSSSSSRTLKIGIIGFGPFGQFLSKTMVKQGHTITATSRSDHSHLSTDLGVSFYRDMDEFFEADNDVIMLCNSILSLSQVVKSMPFHLLKHPTLFVDVLSVKEHPKELLLQGCKMLEMSCEQHDKMAARSQFLTHTIGRALSEMNIESTPIDTKTFQTLVNLKESTMRNSFDLFNGLFIHNKFAQQELKNLEAAIDKVKQKLLDRMNEELDPSVSNNR